MTSLQPLTRVCLMFGGTSEEHEISLRSASSVRSYLDPKRYSVSYLGITREGKWLDEENSRLMLEGKPYSETGLGRPYLPSDVEVVFPILHGTGGEDGTIQGWLEVQGTPFVGSSCLGSAIAMDKSITKHMLRSANIPVLPWQDIAIHEWRDDALQVTRDIADRFSYPLYVKPTQQGSSIGISRVESKEQLFEAIEMAFKFSDHIIAEPAAEGTEYEVAVLDGEVPVISLPGEIAIEDGWYDYEQKYQKDSATLSIPAETIQARMAEQLRDFSLKAFKVLRLTGYARVDFLLDKKTGRFALNEVNTIPGFTSISMFPKLMEHSGIDFSQLVDRLIALALNSKIALGKKQSLQREETVQSQ